MSEHDEQPSQLDYLRSEIEEHNRQAVLLTITSVVCAVSFGREMSFAEAWTTADYVLLGSLLVSTAFAILSSIAAIARGRELKALSAPAEAQPQHQLGRYYDPYELHYDFQAQSEHTSLTPIGEPIEN